ncbi:hypothetical protein BFP97_10490 [Roseivirga sp. 4D4]|uniref:lipocalin family protein n=1 Tax=Roseivirga sp. 4D4 TaxID=1889784 RepID=UPI000852F580|nr:lipocalin family protein [Roseivirga sp. 4D4]OEK01917.1 hypothetical protein BFP97_10490 [Roseivirga sp. 4D4]
MKKSIYLLLLISFASCRNTDHLSPLDLVGTWQNTALNVDINSVNDTDSMSTLVVAPGEWEKVLSIKPIKTTYWTDGTFASVYIGLDGKELGREKGKWSISNDSLILVSNNYRNAYRVTFSKDQARFVSLLDWDQDGSRDDLYDGWQKKVN